MVHAEPDPVEGPTEDSGFPLLRPAEEANALRRRRERPAEIGQTLLVLLGAVCAGASLALWLTHGSVVALGLLAFGVVLIALGLFQHWLLRRERSHRVDQAHLWESGIELVLHNDEVRAASWTDAALALDVFVRPRRNSEEEDRLLVWRMDPKVPAFDLSKSGLEQLRKTVVEHDLGFTEYRRGRKTRESRAYEIRSSRHDAKPSTISPETSRSTL